MRSAQEQPPRAPSSTRYWILTALFILLAGGIVWFGWYSPWAKSAPMSHPVVVVPDAD